VFLVFTAFGHLAVLFSFVLLGEGANTANNKQQQGNYDHNGLLYNQSLDGFISCIISHSLLWLTPSLCFAGFYHFITSHSRAEVNAS